jgi:hypothetical protein
LRAASVYALVGVAGLVAIVSPTDPDIFWHLANGRHILATGWDPADVFSFSAHGRPSMAHEWLFDVASFVIARACGYRALVVLSGLVQLLTAALFVHCCRRRGAGHALTLALLSAFLLLTAHTWGVRAQLVTAPLAGAVVLVLARFRDDPRRVRPLLLLVPLLLAWANLHASFPVGLALIGLYLVGAVVPRFIETGRATSLPVAPLALSFAASAVATLANPRGVTLWTYPLPFLFSDDPIVRTIDEWRPLDFRSATGAAFIATALAAMLVGIARLVPQGKTQSGPRVHLDVVDAGLTVVFTVAALRYGRLTPLYGMLVLPILGGALARAIPRLSRRAEVLARPPTAPDRKPVFVVALLLPLLAVVLARSPAAQLGASPLLRGRFSYPALAADALLRSPPARIFNEYAWGGYLLYTLYPHDTVFIDGRADLYRDGVFGDYVAVSELAPSYGAILDRYGVDAVLVLPGAPLATVLRSAPGWRLVVEDDVAVLFRRQVES